MVKGRLKYVIVAANNRERSKTKIRNWDEIGV
jgi:hypothetical protein